MPEQKCDESLEAMCKHGTMVNAIQNAAFSMEIAKKFSFQEAEEFIVKLYEQGYRIVVK